MLGGHCVSALAPFSCRYRSFETFVFVTFERQKALIAQKLRSRKSEGSFCDERSNETDKEISEIDGCAEAPRAL